ncbi:hypothetical protein EI555_004993 [Monodon monoceros]|uniref:Laminin G domain-containing protein n=1 Tax=Monodon monoceros TaxID=40151 RepID=A0A4U1ESK4_MONMO|nr:hypothetical protein EI555_004993 [Monodon monoceros]
MNVTKNVKFQKEVDVDKGPYKPDDGYRRHSKSLAKNAITAAIKSMEEAENPIKNIDWITQGEFTEERGRKQIEDFISNWEYQGRWVHYTEFLKREDVFHSFHYIYCVHWSIPTARRPIARTTASVYFTIKINTNKPPDTPIDVSYVFESHSLVHRPGMTHFQEKCLRDIIEAKYILMNSNIFQFNSVRIFQNILGIDFSSDFVGCLRNFQLDLKPLDTASASFGVSPCLDGSLEKGIYFSQEGGHVILANSVLLGPEFKLVFSIRPRSLTGILFHIGSQPRELLCVYMETGKVTASVGSEAGGILTSVTPKQSLCDGQWHSVTVTIKQHILHLKLDADYSSTAGRHPPSPLPARRSICTLEVSQLI